MNRTAFRTAAVIGATAALSFAGAGLAAAATYEVETDGNDVSVTFESGWATTDTCVAALVHPLKVAQIVDSLATSDIDLSQVVAGIASNLEAAEGVHVLTDGPTVAVPVVPGATRTVTAEDVPANLYTLFTVCASDLGGTFAPGLEPVIVGNPLEVVSTMSAEGTLQAGSSVLQGESGIGAVLSSALGGS